MALRKSAEGKSCQWAAFKVSWPSMFCEKEVDGNKDIHSLPGNGKRVGQGLTGSKAERLEARSSEQEACG